MWVLLVVAPLLAQLPLNVSSKTGNASLRVQADKAGKEARSVAKPDDEGDVVFRARFQEKGDDGDDDDSDDDGDDEEDDEDDEGSEDDDEGSGKSEDEKDDDDDDYRAKSSGPKTGDDITTFDPVTDEARKFSLPVETTAKRIIAEPKTSRRAPLTPLPGTKTFPELSRLTNRLYILNINDDDRVDVLNTTTLLNDAQIDLASGLGAPLTSPQDMALTPDGGLLVVTNLGFGFENLHAPPHLTFIDTNQDKIVDRMEFEEGFRPWFVTLAPDGALAYVFIEELEGSTVAANSILVVDVTRREVVDQIPLETKTTPRAMALTADGALLFLHLGSANRLVVVDTRSRTVAASLFSILRGNLLALHPNGTELYIGPVNIQREPNIDGIAVIDIATLTESARIPIRSFIGGSQSIVVTLNGKYLYLSDPLAGLVTKISTRTWRTVSEIEIEPVIGIMFTAP